MRDTEKNNEQPRPEGPAKDSQEPNKKSNFPRPKFSPYWIYGLIILGFFLIPYMYNSSDPAEISPLQLDKMIEDFDVRKIVVVNKEFAEIYLKQDIKDSAKYSNILDRGESLPDKGPHFILSFVSREEFDRDIRRYEKLYSEDGRSLTVNSEAREDYSNLLGWIIPLVLFIAIWIFIIRRMSGMAGGGSQIFNIGKSKAKLFDKEAHIKTDFKDVAGLDEAKIEVLEIVEFLKNPKKFTELGGKIPKGALIIGPPGTGKTLLARAVAGEANVPFFSMSGSDFVEMFVGVGASRVRDLFKQAKEKAPCIVFIDEIDAIGRSRGKHPSMAANDERENTLNQLLTEMDGFAPNSGVIILAATNRADVLDTALVRAGRFDRQIHVELPDLNERKEIFKVHLRPIKVDKDVDVEFLAKQTPGFSGADIANVCNESALIAARKDNKAVQRQDFLDAVDRIIGGLEKRSKIITATEKRSIAYHEAGHATVSWLLEYANPLFKVTIIPRGRALGAAWYLPEERQLTTKEQILDEMCAALGGRASEKINFNQISTGALNDLERVTKQAYAMIVYFGMGDELGNISFYDSSGQSEYSFQKPYSETTAEVMDKEAKKIVDEQYERAKKILRDNKEGLIKLAEKLLEKEVIFSEDLEEIFGKRPYPTYEEEKQKSKPDSTRLEDKENKD